MTVQCGATECSRVSGFRRRIWPTAADRRGFLLLSEPPINAARATTLPGPGRRPGCRGIALLGGLGCEGSLPPPTRGLREVVAGRRPLLGPFRGSGRGRPRPTGGQRGSPRRRGRAEPGRPQQVRRGRLPAPPAARPAFTCSGGSRVRGGRPGPDRPSPPGRPSSPDARTGGPTDASGRRRRGARAPAPKARAQAPAGGARAAGEAATARPGLRDRVFSRRPGHHPRSQSPATRGPSRSPAFPRGFWSLPLAVLLAPPPRPPGCQGNPSDACRGREALGGAAAAPGGAAAAPGARPLGAREQLTMEPQSKGVGPGGPEPPGSRGAPRARSAGCNASDAEARFSRSLSSLPERGDGPKAARRVRRGPGAEGVRGEPEGRGSSGLSPRGARAPAVRFPEMTRGQIRARVRTLVAVAWPIHCPEPPRFHDVSRWTSHEAGARMSERDPVQSPLRSVI